VNTVIHMPLCDRQSSWPAISNTPPQTATANSRTPTATPLASPTRQPAGTPLVSYRYSTLIIHPQLLTRSPPPACLPPVWHRTRQPAFQYVHHTTRSSNSNECKQSWKTDARLYTKCWHGNGITVAATVILRKWWKHFRLKQY